MSASGAQSQTPPYPSAARFADSMCYAQYTASLKYKNGKDIFWTSTYFCLEKFSSDKSKCQEHFDIYKECKKKEREGRLERNKSRSLFS